VEGLDKATFISKVKTLTLPKKNDPEYDRKKKESDGLVEMLVRGMIQKSGDEWDGRIASENYRRLEWFWKQP
jgi:hypothetical protein